MSIRRAWPARFAWLAALGLLATACAAPPSPSPSPGSTNLPASSSPGPSASASPSATETCAERTLNALNEGQRVGQLFLIGLAANELGQDEQAAIETYQFGSVWFTEKSQAGQAAIRAVADEVQALAASLAPGPAPAGIGFLVAANQEGGLVQALNGPGFATIPSALKQGAGTLAGLRANAATWGAQLKAAGINLDFAPVSDVVPAGTDSTNQPIGVLHREYGHDPATVGSHAAAFVAGMTASGVLTVAKHFPGLGRVVGNTDVSAGVVDTATTSSDPSLGAFRTVIAARVPIVMVALATYTRIDPNHLAAFSPIVIGTVLRGQLGFTGIVMSDDLGATSAVAAIAPATRGVAFIAAGGDMIISKTIQPAIAMAIAITARASTDPAFRSQVNQAALRVLQVKATQHLLACTPS